MSAELKKSESKVSLRSNKDNKLGPTYGAKEKKIKAPAISRSKRAGLTFPVSRVHRYLRKGSFERIGTGAAVYITAVLEYLTAEMLELAGDVSRDLKKTRIIPRHIQLAVRHDDELGKLLQQVTIAEGGVLPFIHAVLQPKKTQAKLAEIAAVNSIKSNSP
ncbi:hypothetical protein PVAND_014176 [Polypedilum vanderplanki]|uniref:Histone H2A n=1 Tax=Polypedilum vanderplanki TaxID=319348 RepID=A0A9J6CST3_POLVA|nr:hypothetical protein PVAND_014176 [Polypedilum vanderplanki]